jgi:ribosomal protein S15P/S13E
VTEHICKLAKKGMTPSQIGVLLRDSHGIPQVTTVTGSKILRILKGNGAAHTAHAPTLISQNSSYSGGRADMVVLQTCTPGHQRYPPLHCTPATCAHYPRPLSPPPSSSALLGLGPEIPEDLYHLIKKAVSMRKHLERSRKDKDGKFRLILIESRIHRLARYYKVRHMIRHSMRGRPGCVCCVQPHPVLLQLCIGADLAAARCASRLCTSAEGEEAATQLQVRLVNRLHPGGVSRGGTEVSVCQILGARATCDDRRSSAASSFHRAHAEHPALPRIQSTHQAGMQHHALISPPQRTQMIHSRCMPISAWLLCISLVVLLARRRRRESPQNCAA